jgi:hypothetical protein
MTVIVGLTDTNGKVYLGADSFSGHSYFKQAIGTPKLFEKAGMVFGYTSSFRMGQLLHYSLGIPKYRENELTIEEYFSGVFIDSVRKVFEKAGWQGKDSDGREEGGNFLVGYRGRLFEVQQDYSVIAPTCGYAAVGAGQDFAYGSLASSEDLGVKVRMKLALLAAEKHSPLVCGPFHILQLDNNRVQRYILE